MDYNELYKNRDKFKNKFPKYNEFGRLGQTSPLGNPWSSGGEYNDGNTSFVKKLIVIHDIKTIIEIGSGEGASTRPMLEALDITDGYMYACDMTNFQQLPHGHKRFNFWAEKGENLFDKMPNQCDLLHIDTSPHTYDQMKYWLFESKYFDKVKPGGFILLHDVGNSWDDPVWGEDGGDGDKETDAHWTNHRGPFEEFIDKFGWQWTFNKDSNRWGLGLMRKPE